MLHKTSPPWPLLGDIWWKPRATIRAVVDRDPAYYQQELFWAVVILSSLAALPMELLALNFFANLLVYGLSVYATGWLVWLTGRPLGGEGRPQEICTAIVWSFVPTIGTLVVDKALGLFLPPNDWVSIGLFLIGMFWSLKLILFTIAEIQRFSVWESILNQLLALGVMLVPLIPLAWVAWQQFGSSLMQQFMPF